MKWTDNIFLWFDKKEDKYKIDLNMIYMVLSTVGLIIHIVYEVFFVIYSKEIIMKYNILSILIYLLIIIFRKKISFNAFVLIVNFEVAVFATVAIFTIGFGYGFELLFLILISTNIFSIYGTNIIKNMFIILAAYLFFKLSYSQKFLWNFDESLKVFYTLNFVAYFVMVNLVNYMVIKFLDANAKLNSINLVEEKNKYREMVTYDNLTGLPNRMYMKKELCEACDDYNSGILDSLTVVFADIDNFKNINDTYGHLNGDIVLSTLGKVLQNSLRKEDVVCRWGGEEFIILMKNVDRGFASRIMDKVRDKVSKEKFVFEDQEIYVTMTFGVCSAYDTSILSDDIVKRADELLYEGKSMGKNVVIYKEI